jgi:hypothetical protein
MDISEKQIINALRVALDPQRKEATGTPVGPYLHGPGGLFGVSGLERDVISTRVQPKGLASILPAVPTTKTNPLFPYITGFLGHTAAHPSTACANCPPAGAMKNCIQTAQFGRYCFATREMEVNRPGQIIDRGEFLDLRLVNDPLVNQLGGIFGNLAPQDQILAGREVLARMLEVGIEFQNILCTQLWRASPANNLGTGYLEFLGLDLLIGTTKVDALTNTDCPSLDSDVKDFMYRNVNTDGAPTIDRMIAELFRILKGNASKMNFGETKWVIVMREDLFYELTAYWPCKYHTDRCTNANIQRVVLLSEEIQIRDQMRQGSYLLIDGDQIPVVLDDCIREFSSGDSARIPVGCYSSDIYVVPMTVRGGMPVTYWQYLDYNATNGAMQAINDGRASPRFWTDGGKYLWTEAEYNWCISWQAKIEPRVILQTPHLAGRLNNVVYCPLQHSRNPLPGDPYFVDGGVTTGRPAPSYYNDYVSRGQ